ncbi:hypothetical protein [Actinomadura sp. NEAU-AAG7]|uniref:hypothetical protein n=1 Tax=Actinomadura sp. NEAU-AAG7 TaxID=2839640 RepID=UPI001BE48079|nr:hypothetical protein [Actinomadura sp. NEAU-AAG7]MBT2213154.1 hypothetical protein [Actinomadura sp. NEAU-AAG7]
MKDAQGVPGSLWSVLQGRMCRSHRIPGGRPSMPAILRSSPLIAQQAPSPPLFSIPEAGWWIIAIGASLLAIVVFPRLYKLEDYPEDLRPEIERRKSSWKYYLAAPFCLAALLGANLLAVPGPRSDAASLHRPEARP